MNNMIRFRYITLCILLAFSISITAQKTYVVAVGLDKYQEPNITELATSISDVKGIAHFFHDYNGAHVFMLLNQNATRSHILKVLKMEFAKSTEKDEIIFAFSGHGAQGGLSCYDMQSLDDLITYNEVMDIMEKAKARRKVILADACFSGGMNVRRSNSSTPPSLKNTSVLLYMSSRADETSQMSPNMMYSYFTNGVLLAFRGQADANHDKKVTARELFNYVNKKVVLDTDFQQHPQMWGKFDDDMVVVYVK